MIKALSKLYSLFLRYGTVDGSLYLLNRTLRPAPLGALAVGPFLSQGPPLEGLFDHAGHDAGGCGPSAGHADVRLHADERRFPPAPLLLRHRRVCGDVLPSL